MNNLLIDDYPILVLPKLATEIGLNEAIVLQQMHYWLKKSNHNYDGRRWIYNSYKEWEQHFPFWSNATIRRTISSLEKQELLFVGNYNKAGFDNTKWYSIDYFKLEGVSKRLAQNEQTTCSKRADGVAQNEQTNTRDYTEITTETTNNNILSGNPTVSRIPYKEIVDYLNEKTGKNFKHKTAKTRKFIEARWNQDFRLDDFKKVIDIKTDEWLNTDSDKYLRPETLFGTKFESYLNQKLNLVAWIN